LLGVAAVVGRGVAAGWVASAAAAVGAVAAVAAAVWTQAAVAAAAGWLLAVVGVTVLAAAVLLRLERQQGQAPAASAAADSAAADSAAAVALAVAVHYLVPGSELACRRAPDLLLV
jgi:uncharacterized membrane protein